MITEQLLEIRDIIKGRVMYNEPMKRHTSFRTGGPAEIWVEPEDIDSLRDCLMAARERTMPVIVIGGGTNMLVRDEGIKGMVISMTSPSLRKIYHGDFKVSVSSAVRLTALLRSLADHNLSGLEFLAGVPGTVGGAVAMNAGCRHYKKKDVWKSIGDFVEEIKALDHDGNRHIFGKNELSFGYRSSGLDNLVVTEVKFLLTKDDKEKILGECRNFLSSKKATQDLTAPSAGCVFKNPAAVGISAGELIDKCGLKAKRVGGAAVSVRHANFIINTGAATSADILKLIEIVKAEVKNKFGVDLEPEIKIV